MQSHQSQSDQSGSTAAVKIPVMLFMFLEILFFGSLPLRLKAFKENKLVLSLSGAFSGGLFLGIGLIHLLPESNESFENYYKEKEDPLQEDEVEHFPWAFLISTLAFALILFIEKILTAGWGEDIPHGHSHGHDHENDHENSNDQKQISGSSQNEKIISSQAASEKENFQKQNEQSSSFSNQSNNIKINEADQESIIINQNLLQQNQNIKENQPNLKQPLIQNGETESQQNELQAQEQSQSDIQEEDIKNSISSTRKLASKISFSRLKENQSSSQSINKLTPYILQIAIGFIELNIFFLAFIGIHAIFEGMAIGLQQDWVACLAISLAVVFHKWAEGLTLGIAYRKANIDLKTSTINIVLQACMNPIGVGIGWALSSQGYLVEGIFTSISVGTFIYIATMEVLVEEFNINRYRYQKFALFLLAIAFVCSLFFMEQATGG